MLTCSIGSIEVKHPSSDCNSGDRGPGAGGGTRYGGCACVPVSRSCAVGRSRGGGSSGAKGSARCCNIGEGAGGWLRRSCDGVGEVEGVDGCVMLRGDIRRRLASGLAMAGRAKRLPLGVRSGVGAPQARRGCGDITSVARLSSACCCGRRLHIRASGSKYGEPFRAGVVLWFKGDGSRRATGAWGSAGVPTMRLLWLTDRGWNMVRSSWAMVA